MNIFDLFRRNQKKEDPFWEFEPSEHFRPKLDTGDFYGLTGFDFGWFVLEPISKFVGGKKGESTKGNTLSYAQKALYYWWYVDAQVNNGGFTQFYYNNYGKYVPTIIQGLKHVGDNEMAELVNRSFELYLKEKRKIKFARKGGWDGFSNLYEELGEFDQLDDEYYRLNKQTMKIIEDYFRSNPNEICLDENGNEFDLSFSGEKLTYYSDDRVKEVIPLDKGIVNGTFKRYFENGNIKEEVHYLNGTQTGIKTKYFENGNKKFSITVSQNPKGNLHSHFYENGNVKSTEIYISKYDRVGKWLRYFPNGQMQSEAEFIKKEFFIQNCWKEDGTQILKDGTGLFINENTYWKGHTERVEHEYLEYARHGKQYTFRNNVLSLYQEMRKGKEHGITKSYDQEGNLKYEALYDNGVEKSRKNYQENK